MLSSFFWKKLLVRTGLARLLPSVRRLLGGGERCLRYLSDRALAAPVPELIDPAWFPDVQAPDAINLALGAPRCEVPLGALRGVNDPRALDAWGLPELREEVASRLTPAPGPGGAVLITHGATGAFAAALDTFVNPGTRVVLFDPTSPVFVLGLKHRRARVRWVRTWLEEGKVRFDIEAFAAAMRGARLLVLSDPCNPTGGLLAPEDLEQIAFWAGKHDVLIYADESFGPFRYEPAATALASLPHAAGRLLRAGGVSKGYGLGAARVGWLAGDRHLLRPVAVTAAMAAPFVSPLGQQAALTALRAGDETVAGLRDEFAGRRRFLFEALQEVGLNPAFPAGGYFFWVPVAPLGLTGREFSRKLVLSKRVLVNPGEPFGPSGKDHVRISFATEEGRLREGVQRLAEFMEEMKAAGGSAEIARPPAAEVEPEPTHQP
jgi:aspartate/methionine/tyrosine aminotransferase